MATLTVTAKGQVTLRKEVLRHLGVEPGDKVEIELVKDGGMVIRRAQPQGTINDFIGCLAGQTDKVATLEEIEKAIQKGWAGQL